MKNRRSFPTRSELLNQVCLFCCFNFFEMPRLTVLRHFFSNSHGCTIMCHHDLYVLHVLLLPAVCWASDMRSCHLQPPTCLPVTNHFYLCRPCLTKRSFARKKIPDAERQPSHSLYIAMWRWQHAAWKIKILSAFKTPWRNSTGCWLTGWWWRRCKYCRMSPPLLPDIMPDWTHSASAGYRRKNGIARLT